MTLKDFLKEQKEERKRLKAEKKNKNKNKKELTGEEKFVKIASIIFGFVVTFIALYTSCSGSIGGGDFGDFESEYSMSIETKELLSLPVDTNLLLVNGKYNKKDWEKCLEKFASVGEILPEKIEDIQENYNLSSNVVVEGTELRGLIVQIFSNEIGMELLDYQIIKRDEDYYATSIVKYVLEEKGDIYTMYLTTTTKIEVINKSLVALDSRVVINNLDDEKNEKVVTDLNKYSQFLSGLTIIDGDDFDLNRLANYLINSSINMFSSSIINCSTMQLISGGIKFIA